MLAVAGVADVDLVEAAVHAVVVEFAVGHAARDAHVHIVFHFILLEKQYSPFSEKYLDKKRENCYNGRKEKNHESNTQS